ncbi:hypothetical protein LguiA_033019 [Lonicera macranthoides]
MEEHKLRCMKVFLSRTTTSLEDFIKATKGFEKRARNCYAEKIDLNVDEFVRILIVDSLFILEAMIGNKISGPQQASFYLPKQVFDFLTDLILLENQIPFFVLKDLYELAFPEHPQMMFLKVSTNYLSTVFLIPAESNFIKKIEEYLNLGLEIKHFVDLLRIIHLPSVLRKQPANRVKLISIPNAVQLQEAGIQLLKSGISDCLLDIKYTKGVLEIPLLIVQEYSEIVLSNILVLETCHYLHDSYIRDYVFFMQMLVDTAEDANILIQNKIIEDWTGESSNVASLFNKVGNTIVISGTYYYFFDTSKSLNMYCNATQNKWKAILKRDYCSTPFMIASTMVAAIFLILTFLSTVSSFLAL